MTRFQKKAICICTLLMVVSMISTEFHNLDTYVPSYVLNFITMRDIWKEFTNRLSWQEVPQNPRTPDGLQTSLFRSTSTTRSEDPTRSIFQVLIRTRNKKTTSLTWFHYSLILLPSFQRECNSGRHWLVTYIYASQAHGWWSLIIGWGCKKLLDDIVSL